VALTANMMTHQVAGYRDAGFDDQIGKPIELRALAELMDRVRVGHYASDLSDDQAPDVAARG
jgi:CheY-like chemotaxis protein